MRAVATHPPSHPKDIAIIGTGASSLYVLKNLLERVDALRPTIKRVTLFERGDRPGMGMPYHPATTDRYNLCNISSEEIPRLQQPLADWLRLRDDQTLARYNLQRDQINDTDTYARLALGEYFAAQFNVVVDELREHGVVIDVRVKTPVDDIREDSAHDLVFITSDGRDEPFDRVVISTGHSFDGQDVPEHGYFASPWPIHKLLPADGTYWNTTIGLLGASLSAFDVVTSLAHRHGDFEDVGGRLRFTARPDAEQFRIVMHSSNGWLPHLQYAQCRPFREVYRYVSRETFLALRDAEGLLRLQRYFDEVCREVLSDAFAKDGRDDVAKKLRDSKYTLEQFVQEMSAEHAYADAFDGMRKEFPEASHSVDRDRPIHWKETLDDLMYTLSYHAELMPAEDHVRFHKTVVPFLLNVIAAMPLESARILLALNDANRLELVAGRVNVVEKANGETTISVASSDSESTTRRYRVFIDCSGQAGVDAKDFPFPTLVRDGSVRCARAQFADERIADSEPFRKHLVQDGGRPQYELHGIDIDAAYRVVGADGLANPRIFDIAYPHTLGLRPYSYGLQACNHTAGVMIEAWVAEAESGRSLSSATEALTPLHDEVANES